MHKRRLIMPAKIEAAGKTDFEGKAALRVTALNAIDRFL
jgi:hypothetical protein